MLPIVIYLLLHPCEAIPAKPTAFRPVEWAMHVPFADNAPTPHAVTVHEGFLGVFHPINMVLFFPDAMHTYHEIKMPLDSRMKRKKLLRKPGFNNLWLSRTEALVK